MWAALVSAPVWSARINLVALTQYLPLKCPWFWLTDWHCPSCGLARSIAAALNGNLALSLSYHPLGLVLYIGAVSFGLIYLLSPTGWTRWCQWYRNHDRSVWYAVGAFGIVTKFISG